MLLAELNIRHTRRHMPTRRIALGDAYLPTSGPAYGGVLLGAVVSEFVDQLDDDQRELLPRLLREARDGLAVPKIALRYRLQTDVHGLDRSRHRILAPDVAPGILVPDGAPVSGRLLVIELDRHGRAAPQVIGAVMAAAVLPPSGRAVALDALERALRHPGLPDGYQVQRLRDGVPGLAPFAPGERPVANGDGDGWAGIPADRRWAMEVLGVRVGVTLERTDVVARYRRLVRLAHPDHGAAAAGAAERLAELREARELLLARLAEWGPAPAPDHGADHRADHRASRPDSGPRRRAG